MTTPLHNYSLRDLYEDMEEIAEERKDLKARETAIQEEIARREGSAVDAQFQNANKTHGSLTMGLSGNMKLKAERKLDVKYDQAKLREWAASQPWERVNHFLKIDMEVRESVFKSLEPDSPDRKAFVEARTEKVGETKYTLSEATPAK